MLIPISTDRPLRRSPAVNTAIIAVNIVIWLLCISLERVNPEAYGQMLDRLMVAGPTLKVHWWSPVTSMFLHAGPGHLFGNMLVLFVFGPSIEDRFGRGWYALFYLLGGLAAAGLHVAFEDAPALGASGAIAAVTGAYLVLFPRTMVKCFFVIFLSWVQIPAWVFIGMAIVWSNVLEPSFSGSHGVAIAAHLGGYTFGILVSLFLLWRRILPREPYDLFTIGRQAVRRRQLREAALATNRQVQKKVGAASKRAPEEEARAEAVATARAAVAAHLAKGELPAAAAAYRAMCDQYADLPGAATLSKQYQVDLANHLFQQKDHSGALFAYERFLEAYPRDGHAPSVRLMVALLAARYMNDPVRAKSVLTGLESQLRDDHERGLARELTEELA